MTSILAGLLVVILTTTGARSGLPRTVPLLAICGDAESGKLAVIASNWGQEHYPAWYYNLKANPKATGTIKGQVRIYEAHEADGEEYENYWQSAVATYAGYPLYQKRVGKRHIPIMVMTPTDV